MAGAIAIIIVLLAIPVAVVMSGAVASALLGQVLWKDGKVRHEGSELTELSD